MTPQAVDNAVATAETEFHHWRTTSYAERSQLLHRVADLMRKKKTELSRLITLEMGKLIAESEGEIDLSADIIDYYADKAPELLKDQPLDTKLGSAIIRNSPIGVLLGVQPWNFPFYQVARFAAPNVMIGNVVLVKHASINPQCAIAIETLFREAGAP
jgi:succinate-semialdehyde dehydrogenase/glutarate-semialdehyde dehydrogenase